MQKNLKKLRNYILISFVLLFCSSVMLIVGASGHAGAMAVVGGIGFALFVVAFCVLMHLYSNIIKIDAFKVEDFQIIIDNLSKNDEVISAIETYAKTSYVPLKVLEFASLPLKVSLKFNLFEIFKDTNDVYRISLGETNNRGGVDCDYSKFVNQFNNSILVQNYELVKEAFKSRHGFVDGNQYFSDIERLYRSLITQGDLCEGDTHQYYAFLYLLYRARKEVCYDQAINRLKRYELKDNDNENDIIRVMLNNEPHDIICTTIWALRERGKKYNGSIVLDYTKITNSISHARYNVVHPQSASSKTSSMKTLTEVDGVEKYIEIFRNNEELISSIDDYISEHYESVRELEMAILPINISGNKISMNAYTAKDSDYANFLANCNVNLLKQYSNSPFRIRKERMLFGRRGENAPLFAIAEAAEDWDYDLDDCVEYMLVKKRDHLSYSYSELAEIQDGKKLCGGCTFINLKNKYKSLQENNVISCKGDDSFSAFLFIVYLEYKKNYYQRAVDALDSLYIDINGDELDIIRELNAFQIPLDDIINILWLKGEKEKNFLGSYCAFWCYNKFRIESLIEQVKDEFSEADAIDEYINQLSSNENVVTIVKNYVDNVHNENAPIIPSYSYSSIHGKDVRDYARNTLFDLEMAILPIKKKKNNAGSMVCVVNRKVSSNSNYAEFVKNLPPKVSDELIRWRDNCGKTYVTESLLTNPVFEKLSDLFMMMGRQGIFESHIVDESDSDYQFRAFLYLIYRAKKEKYYEKAVERLEQYNIDLDADDATIIEKLNSNYVDYSVIVRTLWALAEKRNNFNSSITELYEKIEDLVIKRVDDLEEKQQINRLLGKSMQKKTKYSIDDIDLMSGEQFENFVAKLFKSFGYGTRTTSLSADQGVDVIAERNNIKLAIQAKCYSSGPVGNHAIMEVVAGAKYYGANKAMVVTNSTFTKSAIELAKSNDVILWDREVLIEKIKEMN